MHNILTVNQKIPICCITVLLNGKQFIDLLINRWSFFIGSTSHIILTSQIRIRSNDVSRFSDFMKWDEGVSLVNVIKNEGA